MQAVLCRRSYVGGPMQAVLCRRFNADGSIRMRPMQLCRWDEIHALKLVDECNKRMHPLRRSSPSPPLAYAIRHIWFRSCLVPCVCTTGAAWVSRFSFYRDGGRRGSESFSGRYAVFSETIRCDDEEIEKGVWAQGTRARTLSSRAARRATPRAGRPGGAGLALACHQARPPFLQWRIRPRRGSRCSRRTGRSGSCGRRAL